MRRFIAGLILLLSSTITSGDSGSPVIYQVNNQSYQGYYISPSKKAPLVVLVHDWDGLTDYEIKRANMLANSGYAVFAVDLFGAGVRPTAIVDKRQHTGELYSDRQKMRALMRGALKAAKQKGANINNAVVMGYCFGGAAVLEMARAGDSYKGFVTFHGGLATPARENYSNTKGKILILHGTADMAVPIDIFTELAVQLESANVPHEMIAYGGAPHAFTVFGTSSYRQDADRKSWQRFQEFLQETLQQ